MRDMTSRLLATILATAMLAGCGNGPDVVALGARELPGTLGAAYLAARPFSLSPTGEGLVFALDGPPPAASDTNLEIDLGLVASLRRLEFASGEISPLPTPPAAIREAISRYGLLHEPGCWTNDGKALLLRTAHRRLLRLAPMGGLPKWHLIDGAPPGIAPGCGERAGPVIGEKMIGAFSITRPGGRGLRITHRSRPGQPLFELHPDGELQQVTVGTARLSPSGDRLALVHATGMGSFTGRAIATVVSIRPGEATSRPLGGTVLELQWRDEGRLVGYARPDGRKEYALFAWDLGL
jgi:hypothetical protein